MAAEALVDNAMNAHASEVEAYVTTPAKASIALTLVHVQAATTPPRRVDSIMVAESAADDAMNADAKDVEAHVTAIPEARTALTLMQAAAARCLKSRMAAAACISVGAAAYEAAKDAAITMQCVQKQQRWRHT